MTQHGLSSTLQRICGIALLMTFLLAIALPTLALAQDEPAAGSQSQQIYLPSVDGGQASDQIAQAALSADIVISQVYGGGGGGSALYTHDFVELFNRGTAPVSLAAGRCSMGVRPAQATWAEPPLS